MVSYVGFGNDTLKKLPRLRSGNKVSCPRCGETHEVVGGSKILFYRCGKKLYLAGVDGRCVLDIKPDVSGEV